MVRDGAFAPPHHEGFDRRLRRLHKNKNDKEFNLHILVLGAAGMVGRKLVDRLLKDGRLGKSDIKKMTLHDVVAPAKPEKAGFPVEVHAGDFAVPGEQVPKRHGTDYR